MFQRLKTTVEFLREVEYSTFVKIVLRYIWQNLLCIPILPYAMYKIRKIDKDCSLDELVDFTFTFCFRLIKPLQFRYELFELLKILDKKKPKYLLEIGNSRWR